MTLSSGQRRHFVPLSPWNKRPSAVGVDSNGYVNFETNLLKKSYNNSLHRMCGTDPVIFKKKKKKKIILWCPRVSSIFFFLVLFYFFSFSPYYLFILSWPAPSLFFLPPVPAGYQTTRKALAGALVTSFLGPLRGSEQSSETVGHHASLSPFYSQVEPRVSYVNPFLFDWT
jgi:hypothetical protein